MNRDHTEDGEENQSSDAQVIQNKDDEDDEKNGDHYAHYNLHYRNLRRLFINAIPSRKPTHREIIMVGRVVGSMSFSLVSFAVDTAADTTGPLTLLPVRLTFSAQ